MDAQTLVNKTTYFMITSASGNEAQMNISIQQINWKSDGQYEVTCIAAKDNKGINDSRQGKYKVKEQSGNKMILNIEEETGSYPGHYEVTFNWFNANSGTLVSKNTNSGDSVQGVFQVI